MKPLILIADTDREMCTTLKNLLEHHGTSVLCTGDGLEALRWATEFLPNVIIRDDSDGFPERITFIQGLAEDPRTAAIPVVRFLPWSGQTTRLPQRSSFTLIKPVSPSSVVNLVESVLLSIDGKRSGSDGDN